MTNEAERLKDTLLSNVVPDSTSDEILWNDFCHNGNKNACARLIEQNQHFAYCVAYSICREKNMAEDATQIAFLELLRPNCSFVVKGAGSFRGWFYGVVFNTAKALMRKQRRRNKYERDSLASNERERTNESKGLAPMESMDNKEMNVALKRALNAYAAIRFPFKAPRPPFVVTYKAKMIVPGGQTVSASSWFNAQAPIGTQIISSSRQWMKDPKVVREKWHFRQEYFIGKYKISLQDGLLIFLNEMTSDYPSEEIILIARNSAISEVEVRGLNPQEIPEALRNPETLIPQMQLDTRTWAGAIKTAEP